MDGAARRWFTAGTSAHGDWPADVLLARKAVTGDRISVVVPARNEAATIGPLLAGLRGRLMDDIPLVDELVVMDSLSTDATASVAADAGAVVWDVADVTPALGVRAGKGEALWKSQFVTTGTLLVFVDADLTDWGPHFVSGLLGPLLHDVRVRLVKGFYDRPLDDGSGTIGLEGGRVTELVARPLLGLFWPELTAVVQPLAGEWAIRRALFAGLTVPEGYGVEFSTLVDTWARFGLEAIAQVDLGRRAHTHQSVHDLGVMATEILHVAESRRRAEPALQPAGLTLEQYDRGVEGGWRARPVPVRERPPASELDAARQPGATRC